MPEGVEQCPEESPELEAQNPIDKDYQEQELPEQQQNKAPSPDMVEEEGGAFSAEVEQEREESNKEEKEEPEVGVK